MPFITNAQLVIGPAGSAVFFIGSSTNVIVGGDVNAAANVAGSGKLIFTGNSLQNLNMNGNSLPNMQVNGLSVLLTGDALITTFLTLTKGIIYSNNYRLAVASTATIQGGSNTSFISTTDALNNTAISKGLLINVPAGASMFVPIGASTTSYNPVTIKNASGPAEQYTLRVKPLPVPNAAAANTLNVTWNIAEVTAGGNTIALTLQWAGASEPAGFTRSNAKIVRSSGVSIVEKTGYLASLGANPYTIQGGAFTGASIFGITSDPNVFAGVISAGNLPDEGKQVLESISMQPTIVTGSNATLVIKAPLEKRYVYTISDMNGKIIARKDIATWKGDNLVPVELPMLANGMYILSVYNAGILKKSIKFLKQ